MSLKLFSLMVLSAAVVARPCLSSQKRDFETGKCVDIEKKSWWGSKKPCKKRKLDEEFFGNMKNFMREQKKNRMRRMKNMHHRWNRRPTRWSKPSHHQAPKWSREEDQWPQKRWSNWAEDAFDEVSEQHRQWGLNDIFEQQFEVGEPDDTTEDIDFSEDFSDDDGSENIDSSGSENDGPSMSDDVSEDLDYGSEDADDALESLGDFVSSGLDNGPKDFDDQVPTEIDGIPVCPGPGCDFLQDSPDNIDHLPEDPEPHIPVDGPGGDFIDDPHAIGNLPEDPETHIPVDVPVDDFLQDDAGVTEDPPAGDDFLQDGPDNIDHLPEGPPPMEPRDEEDGEDENLDALGEDSDMENEDEFIEPTEAPQEEEFDPEKLVTEENSRTSLLADEDDMFMDGMLMSDPSMFQP